MLLWEQEQAIMMSLLILLTLAKLVIAEKYIIFPKSLAIQTSMLFQRSCLSSVFSKVPHEHLATAISFPPKPLSFSFPVFIIARFSLSVS